MRATTIHQAEQLLAGVIGRSRTASLEELPRLVSRHFGAHSRRWASPLSRLTSIALPSVARSAATSPRTRPTAVFVATKSSTAETVSAVCFGNETATRLGICVTFSLRCFKVSHDQKLCSGGEGSAAIHRARAREKER